MVKLSREEFEKRVTDIANARKIFTPHITNNISIAFEMYQQLLEEADRKDVHLSTGNGGRNISEQQGPLLGPKCPECNTQMGLVQKVKDIDKKEWPSAWRCTSCGAMFYNEEDVNQIYDQLVREKYGTQPGTK